MNGKRARSLRAEAKARSPEGSVLQKIHVNGTKAWLGQRRVYQKLKQAWSSGRLKWVQGTNRVAP